MTYQEKIREICTYHSDEGTSGYLLSEDQFQAIFKEIDILMRESYEDGFEDAKSEEENEGITYGDHLESLD